MSQELIFLSDKLPYISEIVLAIVSISPTVSSKLHNNALNSMVKCITTIWTKAFGSEHVAVRRTIKTRLEAHIKTYLKDVYRHKSKNSSLSKREQLHQWREIHNQVFDALKKGTDVSKFQTVEREFYYAQMSPSRSGYITDIIDMSYEPPENSNSKVDDCDESADIVDIVDNLEPQAVDRNEDDPRRGHRSGFVSFNVITEDRGFQTESVQIRPEIRKGKNCTSEVKNAYAKVSSLGISPEM